MTADNRSVIYKMRLRSHKYKLLVLFLSIFIICFFIGYDYALVTSDKKSHVQDEISRPTRVTGISETGQGYNKSADTGSFTETIQAETYESGLTD